MQHNDAYGRLVVGCLQSSGLLCLGLYRLLPSDSDATNRRQKRYVITNPPFSFRLVPSDKVTAVNAGHIHFRGVGHLQFCRVFLPSLPSSPFCCREVEPPPSNTARDPGRALSSLGRVWSRAPDSTKYKCIPVQQNS